MKLEISVCDISFIIVVVFIHRFFSIFQGSVKDHLKESGTVVKHRK